MKKVVQPIINNITDHMLWNKTIPRTNVTFNYTLLESPDIQPEYISMDIDATSYKKFESYKRIYPGPVLFNQPFNESGPDI